MSKPKNKDGLTDFHYQQSKEAQESVKEMLKKPLTAQQQREQIARRRKRQEGK